MVVDQLLLIAVRPRFWGLGSSLEVLSLLSSGSLAAKLEGIPSSFGFPLFITLGAFH